MKLFGKDLSKDLVIIGEVGVNHEGNINTAKKIIRLAKKAGADAVKLQIYTPEKYVSKKEKKFNRVKKFSLEDSDILQLKKFAKNEKIHIFATPVTEDKVKLCYKLNNTIKVASGDINFFELFNEILKYKNNKIIISTGNSTLQEIKKIILFIKERIKEKIKNKIILLHCVSSYPTPIDQANIKRILLLKKEFKEIEIGYSNHCADKEACLAAVALGANLLEVHITDNNNKKFHDHHLSFNAKSFEELIKSAKLIKKSLNDYGFGPSPSEKKNKQFMRKGIIANKNISYLTKIKKNDICFARPATEFNSYDQDKIIGKKIFKNIKKGDLIKKKFFIKK